jgi:phage-related protein
MGILSKAPKKYLYSSRLYHSPVIQPDIWVICSNSKQLRTLGINSQTLRFSISTQMIQQVHQHIVNFSGAGMWHSKIKLPEEKNVFIKQQYRSVTKHAGELNVLLTMHYSDVIT